VVESQASEVPGFIDFYQGVEINGKNTAGLISLKFGAENEVDSRYQIQGIRQ